jgi:hypothetical protein
MSSSRLSILQYILFKYYFLIHFLLFFNPDFFHSLLRLSLPTSQNQTAREKGNHKSSSQTCKRLHQSSECLPFIGIPFSISLFLFLGKHFLKFWWRGVLIWVFFFFFFTVTDPSSCR